jgi:hypothetical protein
MDGMGHESSRNGTGWDSQRRMKRDGTEWVDFLVVPGRSGAYLVLVTIYMRVIKIDTEPNLH